MPCALPTSTPSKRRDGCFCLCVGILCVLSPILLPLFIVFVIVCIVIAIPVIIIGLPILLICSGIYYIGQDCWERVTDPAKCGVVHTV